MGGMLMVFSMICPVWAETVTIDRELLEKILQRQDRLEKEVERLKERVREKREKKALPAAVPDAEDIRYMKEDVEEMSERLDTVERKSILDKIQLGGDFRVRMDSYHYRDHEFNGQKEDGSTDELWSSRFRLTLRSDITDDITFHGRLNYFKLWGDSNYESVIAFDTLYPSIPDSEGNLHVERAYVDYFVPETPLSLTFGRIPLNEGPPNELRDHTSRKGTWPKVVYDGEGDGIIMNLSLDKWTGLENAMFRLGYYKLFQNYQKYKGVKIDDWRGYVASFETEIPGVRDSLFWIGYTRAEDITPLFDVSEISYPEDFGDVEYYNAHFHLNDIMNSGLDCFFSIAWSHISPSSEGTILTPAYEAGVYGDTLHGDLGKSRNAHCIYAGLRYRLPAKSLKYPCAGFEYNYGSKHWLGTAASGDIVNKLLINGDAYEVYYIQPIHERHMFLRIGAVYMDYDYDNPMYYIGSQPESDMSLLNFYFLTHVRF